MRNNKEKSKKDEHVKRRSNYAGKAQQQRTRVPILLFIAGLVIIIVIVSAILLNLNNNSSQNVSTTPFRGSEAMQIVKNYAGEDNSGSTVLESIEKTYNIENPESGTWESSLKPNSEQNIYDVKFRFQSDNVKEELDFVVDLTSKKVSANNKLATTILQLLD